MKQRTKNILLTALLVMLLALSVVGYQQLSVAHNPASVDSGLAGKQEKLVQAPDFTVLDSDGNEVRLSDFAGTPIVLNFWATWSSPCQREMPDFDAAWAEYGDDVVFMMVNMTDGSRDTVEGVKAFLSEKGYQFPVYYDTTYAAAYAYGASSLPTTIFIDAQGYILGGQVGRISNAANLIAGIEALLARA